MTSFRSTRFISVLTTLLAFAFMPMGAQTDTLHLNYHFTQIEPHDSTVKKLENWIKTLNGRKTTINVVAYYHKPEFKKFAQQRCDELFLVLNRKAREVLNIESIGPKKGRDEQRTMVDIVYVSPEKAAALKLKAEEEAKKKAEAKAEKEAKPGKTKTAKKGGDEGSDSKKEKSEPKSEEGKKEVKGKPAGKSKDKKESTGPSNGSPGTKQAGKGLYVTTDDVERIKKAKLVFALTDDKETDQLLDEAIRGYWKFNGNIANMTYNEAKELAKKDPNVLIFIVADIKSRSLTHGSGAGAYRTISYGKSVMLEDGKGKIALASYFPTFGEDHIVTKEAVVFAVSVMNSLLTNMEKHGVKNNMTVNKPYKFGAARLKEKTLVIPDGWLSVKTRIEELEKNYEGSLEVVDYDSWRNVILGKRDKAYVMVVPVPIGGEFVFQHYLMDASTGDVFYVSQPKVAVKVAGVNVSKANTGYINSKNMERYNEAFKQGEASSEEEEKGEEKESKKDNSSGDKDSGDKKKKDSKEKKEKEPKEKKSKEKSGDSDAKKEDGSSEKEKEGKSKDKKKKSKDSDKPASED